MSLKYSSIWDDNEKCWIFNVGTNGIPVKIFASQKLFDELEEGVFDQFQNAANFPGVDSVVVTPDAHVGFHVSVGTVLSTTGTLCQACCGYDIGCGIAAFRSNVNWERAKDEKKREKFSRLIMDSVGMGTGSGSGRSFNKKTFNEIIRIGGRALHYNRDTSEREFIPVDDRWDLPDDPRILRGESQLGSLGGGNHFLELQYDQNGKLWVMIHTGSRGFGHGLASYYIEKGTDYLQSKGVSIRGGAEAVYFEQDNPLHDDYRNAVAAGANYAIANRLLLWESVSTSFKTVFREEPELVYEISHNLAQREEVPDVGERWIHRKGATRAFPAGHPALKGTRWAATGHPILIPGSMGDTSYVLFAAEGAKKSLYSVNHGCGRRFSRGEMKRRVSQAQANDQMRRLNVMVNAGGNVPIDESPSAYKKSKDVIAAVVDAGLATVAYTLTPMASLKGVN